MKRMAALTASVAAFGVPAGTIGRLAQEMGITARDQKIELPIPWTDCWGKEHESVTGRGGASIGTRFWAAVTSTPSTRISASCAGCTTVFTPVAATMSPDTSATVKAALAPV